MRDGAALSGRVPGKAFQMNENGEYAMTISMYNLPAAEGGFAVTREMIEQWRAAYDAGELPSGYAFDGPIKPGRPKLANEAISETDPTVSYVRRDDLEPFDLGSVGAGDTVEALAVHKSGKVEAVMVCGRSLGGSERHGGLWWDLMAPEMLRILEEMSSKRIRALKTVIGRFDPETGLLEASQRELAGLCDTSRTTIGSILKAMEENGLISVEGKGRYSMNPCFAKAAAAGSHEKILYVFQEQGAG